MNVSAPLHIIVLHRTMRFVLTTKALFNVTVVKDSQGSQTEISVKVCTNFYVYRYNTVSKLSM